MSRIITYGGAPLLRSGKVITQFDFNFLGITSLKAWYAARKEIAVADNTAISTVTDWSGNSTALGQATGANQPKYRTNILNGLPAWQFDGSNDQFAFTDVTMTKLLAGISTYVVYKRSSGTGATQTLLQFYNSASAARHSIAINTGASFVEMFAGARRGTETAAAASFAHQDTQFHVVANITNYSADSVSIWQDGKLKNSALIGGTAGDASQNNNEAITGKIGGVTSSFLNGYIAEVIFARAAHSQTETKNIMAALHYIYNGLPQ